TRWIRAGTTPGSGWPRWSPCWSSPGWCPSPTTQRVGVWGPPGPTNPNRKERVMRIINLTPHPVRIYGEDTPDQVEDLDHGVVLALPPSGQFARLGESVTGADTLVTEEGAEIPVALVSYAEIEGLPEPQQGTVFVVPLMTALAAARRDDLLVPYEQVRNQEGTVVGCRRLGRVQAQ